MRVSVVIPTYNCAAYLPSCLDAVFAQTWRDFEVIVVDDGSTDDTEAALRPWRGEIRYIRQANAGVAAARNAGIRISSGSLVAFLDADDVWAKRKLELQLAALTREPEAGLVCSDFSIVNADRTVVDSYFRQRGGYETGRVFARLVRNCFIFTSTVILQRSFIDTLGAFDQSISYCDDYNMWLRAALRGRVQVVPEVLCTKRQRTGNSRTFEDTTACWIGALRNLFAQVPEMGDEERRLLRSEIGRLECSFGEHLLYDQRNWEALPHFWAALMSAPSSARNAALLCRSFVPSIFQRAIRKQARKNEI